MRAMSIGIRWVVRGGQDSFLTSDIGCQKRMIGNDTAIQDADPRTIVQGAGGAGKSRGVTCKAATASNRGCSGSSTSRHYRGIEKLLELGSRNTDARHSQQVSHELIGDRSRSPRPWLTRA